MKATVTKEFRGQGDHDAHERYFTVGETVFGALADAAVKAGNAEEDGAKPAPAAKKGKAKS